MALEEESLEIEALDVNNLEASVESMVQSVMSEKLAKVERWQPANDLFELGTDSLQATRLARLLTSSIDLGFPENLRGHRVTPSFIYQHPSVSSLVTAVRAVIQDNQGRSVKRDRSAEMRALAEDILLVLKKAQS